MKAARSKLAIAALAGVLAAGAPPTAAASRVPAHASGAAATGSVTRSRARETTRVDRQLLVLQARAARLRAGAEHAIAGRMQVIERLRAHLAQAQQGECAAEAACERLTARVPLIEANLAFNEGLMKRREEALARDLASVALAEHAAQARLARI